MFKATKSKIMKHQIVVGELKNGKFGVATTEKVVLYATYSEALADAKYLRKTTGATLITYLP